MTSAAETIRLLSANLAVRGTEGADLDAALLAISQVLSEEAAPAAR